MTLDSDSAARIRPFVSNLERNVFALTGLPEEVVAVLFAYYSRSRDDLRANLARLLTDQSLGLEHTTTGPAAALSQAQDKARAFHEKWVVGYGHASVAEHAVVHLAVENVSIVASKVIEDLRLGSFTEKSTRYVVFDTGSFADLASLPPELAHVYRSRCQDLFGTYLKLFPQVLARLEQVVSREQYRSDKAHANAVRSHACDLLRGLLPASTLTNLGLTANARALATLLTKMTSSPLNEVRELAAAMQTEALTVAPTLLRHVGFNSLRALSHEPLEVLRDVAPSTAGSTPVRLLNYDKDALRRVALALAYSAQADADAAAMMQQLEGKADVELEQAVRAVMAQRGPHDPAPRAFEASSVTVELELDYGAYRDLQRHRLLSPFTQPLTCKLGAHVPEELAELGFAQPYSEALERAEQSWRLLAAHDLWQAQYVVPLAFAVRVLWTLNLRELFHVVELRTSRQGHASYRRVAQALCDAVTAVHPWLQGLIRVDRQQYRLARSG